MADKKDVELLIRATDQSKQTLRDVSANIGSVTQALEKQIEAAKRGDASIDELKTSLTSLKAAGAELIREQGLIDTFNRQAGALQAAQDKSAKLSDQYAKLKAELDGAESVTKKQEAALARLEKQTTNAQAAETKRAASLEVTSAKLAAAGIETEKLESIQKQLVESATKVGVGITAASEAVNGYAENLTRLKAIESEVIDIERMRSEYISTSEAAKKRAIETELEYQAALKKQSDGSYVRDLTALLDKQEAATKAADAAYRDMLDAEAKGKVLAEELAAAELKEVEALNKKIAAAQNLVKSSEYAKLFADQLDLADAQETALAQNQALDEKAARDLAAFKRIADGAEMASRGLKTFSAAQSSGSASNVGDGLRSITDPAEAARQSLEGLEKQIASMQAVANASSNGVKNYGESVRTLQAALKAVTATGDQIDAFRGQTEAVRAAREAFVSARADVQAYTEAIRAAKTPDEQLVVGLKQAQAALAAAGKELTSTVGKARETQDALQRMGVATNNLAGEEQRLVAMARTATTAMNTLNTAYRENGNATDEVQKKIKLFGEGQRESLSLYQRIRGEVIALAAAYVGLQGALGLAKGALDAYVDKQAVENRLGIVVGTDPTKIGQEYAYLHDQAERLGIGIKELADSYSRFALAGKNANLNLDQTKYAFERITEAMRVNHASTDAVNGAFYQLEQMLSKNKVQMDDLRQASNWIPGLEGMLSRGLGMVSVEQLFAAMKKGTVDAKTAVLALGEEMERTYAKQLPDALKSLQAEQGRFETSVTDFKRTIAEAGFADAYVSLLQRISAFFKSSDGVKFAHDISDAFSSTASVLVFLVNNLDTVKAGLEAIITVMALNWARGVVAQIEETIVASAALAAQQAALKAAAEATAAAYGITTAQAMELNAAQNTAAASANVFAKALGVVQKALIAVQVAMVAWDVGKWLDEKFTSVHKFTTLIAEEFGYSWDLIKLGFTAMIDEIINKAKSLPSKLGNAVKDAAASIADSEAPGSGLAERIRASKTEITDGPSKSYLDQYAALQKRHADNMADINRHGGYSNDGRALNIEEQAAADAAKRASDPKGYQLQADAINTIKQGEQDLNALIDERSKKLTDIRAQMTDGTLSKDSAEKQSTAIFASYGPKIKAFADTTEKALKPMIDALGLKAPMKDLQDFQSKLQGALGVYQPNLKGNEKDKSENKRETMAESLQNQLDSALVKVDRQTTGDIATRLAASSQAIDLQYNRLIVKLKDFQKIGGTQIGGKSVATYIDDLESAKTQLKAQDAQKIEVAEITKNERAVNDVVKQRTDLYKQLEDQVKSGSMTSTDATKQATDQASKLNVEIQSLVQKAIQFNETMRGKPGVDNTKLDASNSSLRLIASQSANGGKPGADFGSTMRKDDEDAINKILKERTDITTTYNNLVKLGLSTQHDAQDVIQGDYVRTSDALKQAIDEYQNLLNTQMASGAITKTDFELSTAKIKEFRSQVQYLNPDFVKLKKTFEDAFTNGIVTSLDKSAESIANLITGTENLGDVWKDFKSIIADFFSNFLKQIANAIIQIEAMKVAQSLMQSSGSSTGLFTSIAGAVASMYSGGSTASVNHSGGVIGSSSVSRMAASSLFANAPRYHTGTNGPLGLKPDERAAILQTGEEVLSRDNPRNIMNASRKQGSASAAARPVKQVLAIGEDQIAQAMQGSAGQDVTLTHIRTNADTIKQWLK